MARPKISVLSEEEVEAIHSTSLKILERVGVFAPVTEVLDLLKNAGAEVDYEKGIARIPSHIVEDCIRKAPEVKLFGRDPTSGISLVPGNTYFASGNGSTDVIDAQTGESREGTVADLADLTRTADALNDISVVGELITPQNVRAEIAPQYAWATMLQNTSKPIHVDITCNEDYVKTLVKMGSAIRGSEEELRKRPLITIMACISQPLMFEKSFLKAFVEAAKHKIPILVHSGVMAGATGPVTLAGTIALSNAEILGGIAIAELVSPGAPVIYSSWARAFDMRAENVSLASPEYALIRASVGQLARRYNLPLAQGGFSTDSKILDMQAGCEQYIALIDTLAGTNLVIGTQLDGGKIADCADLVISNELASSYLRILRGFEINEETLAFDVVESVGAGPNRSFMGAEHTHKHYRQELWLQYTTIERRSWSAWKRDGAKDMRQRALDKTKEILKTHQAETLDADVQSELDRIVKEEEKRVLKHGTSVEKNNL